METETILQQAKRHMHKLCTDIGDRSVGSKGNRMATRYFRDILEECGWNPESTLLSVMDWKTNGATLTSGNNNFEIQSSPYSIGCSVSGELVAVSSLDQLLTTNLSGKIVLLHGDIAREQIMPRNFVFYNPEEHRQVIAALDQSGVRSEERRVGKECI